MDALKGFYMPAEWAPQQAVWMIWPHRPDNWREHGAPAQATFARLAEAIAVVTPVYMAVPAAEINKARATMPAAVTLVEIDSDDAWARDTGPTVVVNDKGDIKGLDWRFNAWGGDQGGLYSPWDQDQAMAQAMLAQHGIDAIESPLVLEGGSIHVDGEGTLLTTKECLLNANRNPALSQEEIEQHLRNTLGVTTFIWLDQGVYMDETDGHIDNMACFARPGEVILHGCEDPQDPQYVRTQAAFEVLSSATDARGRKLKVWLLPQPGPLYISEEEAAGIATGSGVPRPAGERMAASYVNFLITNGRLLFPLLDASTDDVAKARLQEIFPELDVVGIPAREILLGGGNIHCITQQIPAV